MTFSYLLLCFMIPNVLWQFLNREKLLRKKDAVTYILWTNIYWLCCAMAVYAAGMGTVWDLLSHRRIIGGFNFIPFSSEGGKSYILNTIMLMPFGFLLPFIWREYRSFGRVCLSGFCFSLLIEFFQIFTPRVSSFDDLLMNTLGTCIGYSIWFGFSGLSREKSTSHRSRRAKRSGFTGAEPMKYLLIGMLSVFLLYNSATYAQNAPVQQEGRSPAGTEAAPTTQATAANLGGRTDSTLGETVIIQVG